MAGCDSAVCLSLSSHRLIAMDDVTAIHRQIDRHITYICVPVRLKQNNKLSSYRNQNEELTTSQNYESVGD